MGHYPHKYVSLASMMLLLGCSSLAEPEVDDGQSLSGRLLLLTSGESYYGLASIQPDGRDRRPIPLPEDFRNILDAAVSPDGKTVAFVGWLDHDGNGTGQFDVFLVQGDGSGFRRLTQSPTREDSPVWLPDGSALLLQIGGTISLLSLEDGEIVPVVTDGVGPSIAANGTTFAFAAIGARGSGVHFASLDGTWVQRCTSCPPASFRPDWSPSDNLVVFAMWEWDSVAAATHYRLATVRPSTGEFSLLTGIPPSSAMPVWSPDGATIAFMRWGGADSIGIYRATASGEEIQLVTPTAEGEFLIGWVH